MTWENFTREEFACKCGCGRNEIRDEFIDVMQEIRSAIGSALIINSGYRCPDHPIEASKDEPGEHSEGTCADVSCSHRLAFRLNKAASNHPKITVIGVQQKGGGRYLHLGIGPAKPGRPRPHLYSY